MGSEHKIPATRAITSSPLWLPCGVRLSNRIAKAAMSEQLAGANNEPTRALIDLYTRWATSGAGLLITGNVMVDRTALSEPGQVVLADDSHLALFGSWASAARSGGSSVWMQINHAGRQMPRMMRHRSVAPSPVGLGPLFARPTEISLLDIRRLVHRYAHTAALAVRSGFDGVQIHGAHGYLISQFLSPAANQRTDAYGGSPERRRRFLIEVIHAVREAVGPGAAVAVKLNSGRGPKGQAEFDEVLDHVRALDGTPIDLLELSGGDFQSALMLGVQDRDGQPRRMDSQEGYFVGFAGSARAVFSKPLMVTGGFRSVPAIEATLASGVTDLIGLGRPLIEEPEFAHRILRGLAEGSASRAGSSQRSLVPGAPQAKGLLGGLAEIAWHTVRIWDLAHGQARSLGASSMLTTMRYLGVQLVQRLRLSGR